METLSPSMQEALRQAMTRWASGVTVVVARSGQEVRGMTASSFTSVSLDPPLVLVCVDHKAHLLPVLRQAERFSINLLAHHAAVTSAHFAGRPQDGFDPLTPGPVPVVQGALVSLICSLWANYDGGDHCIVVGQVEEIVLGEAEKPLVYWNRGYRQLE